MEGYWAIDRYLGLLKIEDRRGRMGARSFLEGAIDSRVALGMCFSRESDLLSQWRGYASGGRGICISFSVAHLKVAIEQLRASLPKLNLTRVDYLRHLDSNSIKAIDAEFGSQIEQARVGKEGDDISMSKSYENGGRDRETNCVARFFSIKNPAFAEEREWRVLLVDYSSSIPDLKFRESNGLLSPYIAIPIDPAAISSIRLGPLHPTPRRDIERLLSTFGIDPPVKESAASYVLR